MQKKFFFDRIANEGKHQVSVKDVKLLAPIQNPDKVACVGLNYRGHCEEQNLPLPKEPMVFSKFSSCIVGPYDDIKYPTVSDVRLTNQKAMFNK